MKTGLHQACTKQSGISEHQTKDIDQQPIEETAVKLSPLLT